MEISPKIPSQGSTMQPEQFFDFYSHQGAKEMLWKWFTATVTDRFSELTPVEKENIITLYERLNNLLDGINALEEAKLKDNG